MKGVSCEGRGGFLFVFLFLFFLGGGVCLWRRSARERVCGMQGRMEVVSFKRPVVRLQLSYELSYKYWEEGHTYHVTHKHQAA